MTTIIIDTKNKTMYSDSRSTHEQNSVFSHYDSDAVKLYEHPTKRLIACICGDYVLCARILKRYGFDVPFDLNRYTSKTYNFKNISSNVVFLNEYNHTASIITATTDNKEREHIEMRWSSGCKRITGGSGADIAAAVYDKTLDPLKAMIYAGLVDKYTDTNIKTIKL